jgi:hypothetical protein
MKNFRILLFVAVASLFAACDDAIDIKQPSELLPEDTFETVKDLTLGLNGVYGVIPGENHIIFTSIFTDEVRLGIANGGQGRDGELAFALNNNSGDAASIWLSNYSLVNFANRLLVGAKNVTPTADELSSYNDIVAQARALRAYGHFQLLTFFSPDMKNDSGLGVIALDFVPTKEQKLPRNTNGEVFALINSDLDFAAQNLLTKTAQNKGSLRTYVSTDFVKALKVRMAIYRGQYDAAEADVDALIAAYPLTKKFATGASSVTPGDASKLINESAYFKLFRDALLTGANSNEVIFKLERAASASTTTGNFYQAWSSVNSKTTGGAFFEVSTALYNNLLPNDIRRTVIIDPSAFPAFNVRPVGKYAESEKTPLLADVKIFRASEMVLLKAEILANRSDFPGVANAINAIRVARFGDASANIGIPGNIQAAWAAILDERRLELAFEGHRYIDIKRLGTLAGKTVDRTPSDCSFNNVCTLEATDYRWTMPVPRPEQAANPNIQQNPGYNNK